jgi:hypothetical protein
MEMSLRRIITVLVLLLSVGALVACGQQAVSDDAEAEAAGEAETEEAPAEVEVAEEQPSSTPPLPTPPRENNDESCLNCHADEEVLKAMATESEAGEARSSGEG